MGSTTMWYSSYGGCTTRSFSWPCSGIVLTRIFNRLGPASVYSQYCDTSSMLQKTWVAKMLKACARKEARIC